MPYMPARILEIIHSVKKAEFISPELNMIIAITLFNAKYVINEIGNISFFGIQKYETNETKAATLEAIAIDWLIVYAASKLKPKFLENMPIK